MITKDQKEFLKMQGAAPIRGTDTIVFDTTTKERLVIAEVFHATRKENLRRLGLNVGVSA